MTPVSHEAILTRFAASIRSSGVRYAVLNATDPLDLVFLARYLRTLCSDVRLITFRADELLVRAASEDPLIGSLVITNYPLVSENQQWTEVPTPNETKSPKISRRNFFPSSDTQAVYNGF